ncbi:FAD-dependent oxidoreductase domain-containing protein 1 [Asbolus verrucosus]|uniref:FAD-dependent oxidoreductase domain-containing protein 1 n=1 Tax=Asbolus verrucosus TaxID=1661398 RepID=A0A482W868_ASBVE|nr:FAD-dependent oxidoreductase domain-containing protein 1 [Asbolus verrucosus]
MFTKQLVKVVRNFSKNYHTVLKTPENHDQNCTRIVSKNFTKATQNFSTDVVVVGGGAMGASVAYWLKEKTGRNKNLKVVVIEKDPTYAQCSTSLSVGGIRQQFSVPENIQMSLFGAEFLKTIKEKFGAEADISYTPNGYLILASASGMEQLMSNFNLQQEMGVTNQLLSKDQLKERFPWMNVEDVELGTLGGEKEGWFDPWGLLNLLKHGATDKGAQFLQGEVVDFIFNKDQTLHGVVCVITAGAESGNVAKLAKIGTGLEDLAVALPVERRKRYVYRFDCRGEGPPPLNSPLVIDYTGAYFRKDGNSYIGGLSPQPEEEPNTDNLEVDFDYFDNRVWPLLACRVPAFESVKVKSAWGGFYEHNCFDANGIIGPHPHYQNLYFATGFSGHGIQQSPAAGLAIAELILDGRFKTIDLTRMGFDRLITNKPLYEIGIY